VVVDTQSELLAAMNASNSSLVASIATDDPDVGSQVAGWSVEKPSAVTFAEK
jgi:hypothetical protein